MVGPKTPRDSSGGARRAAVLYLAVCLVAVGFAGCRTATATLSDLTAVEVLEDQFNRDAGKTRIVMLLSPT